MTTTVEVYAGDFCRLFEAKPNTNFCDVCNKRLNRTSHYRHVQSFTHPTTLYRESV